MRYLLGLIAVFAIAPNARSADQAHTIPVGERVYVDTGNLWEPLKIVPRSSGEKGVLDPNLNRAQEKVEPAPVLEPVAKKPASQPASLVFDKVDIRGRLSQPRVNFGRTRLEVGRVDQRINTSRYNRIFEVRRGDL